LLRSQKATVVCREDKFLIEVKRQSLSQSSIASASKIILAEYRRNAERGGNESTNGMGEQQKLPRES
jgi:hypothetical protein